MTDIVIAYDIVRGNHHTTFSSDVFLFCKNKKPPTQSYLIGKMQIKSKYGSTQNITLLNKYIML